MLKLIIPALILLLTAAPHAHPGTITVRPNGTGDYPTIQDAINAAANSDEIVCSDGTYTGEGNRDIDFLGKAITVRSESGPENCIIDCEGSGPAFEFSRGEDANSMLDGFTITTSANYPLGMGILCYGASPTINNCQITGMQSGMGLQDCNSKITNCIIMDNKGEGNGGIACYSASPIISNCIISGNVAESIPWFRVYGGGIGCVEGSSPTIKDCIISDNSASYGGGIGCLNGSNPVITNCTITGNSGRGSGIYCENSSPAISNCTLSENKAEDEWAVVCSNSVTIMNNCEISGNAGSGVNCWRSNLTIANCTIHGHIYSGIMCDDSTATINSCIISGNAAGEYQGGGGIEGHGSTLTIINSTIADNIAGWGGGIYAGGGSTTMIANCIISNNSAQGEYAYGGGIFYGTGSHTISNSVISGNTADEGGAIYCIESNLRVDMCTISNNRSLAEGDWPWVIRGGGGVYCEDASLTITDTTMADNTADGNFSGGGAILCRGSTQLEITDCTISGNSAKIRGGGICCDEETVATITGCKIVGNSSEGSGGGILCMPIWDKQTKINNCLITGNSAEDAGGIAYYGNERPDITNCTIANNIARSGYGGGIVIAGLCRPELDNCILWGNRAEDGDQIALVARCVCSAGCRLTANYCNIEGGPEAVYKPEHGPWWLNWDNGNIDADPCFVEPGYWDVNGVWVEGDYRLLEGSPCIDAGDPNYTPEPNETDLEGNPRVLDGDEDGVALVDMGAYEYVPLQLVEAEMTLTPHALNCASKGRWVKAHVVLPEGYLPEDVDIDTPAVALPMDVESEYINVFASGKGTFTVEIRFDRAAFCDALTETGEIEVTVTGSLTTGQYFYATDTVRIKPNPRQITPKFQKTRKKPCILPLFVVKFPRNFKKRPKNPKGGEKNEKNHHPQSCPAVRRSPTCLLPIRGRHRNAQRPIPHL